MIRTLLTARWSRIVLLVVALIGLSWGTFEAVIRSRWLGDRIRGSVIESIEAATGLPVSIERLKFGKSRLHIEIEGLTLRTSEDPTHPPLVSVPQVSARIGLRSFLGGRTYLESLQLRNPRVRVLRGEGESWSIPWQPTIDGGSRLVVAQIDVTGGSIEWNGEPYGIAFAGTDLEVEAAFDPVGRTYSIQSKLAEATWGSAVGPPLAGSAVEISATASTREIRIHTGVFRGESMQLVVADGLLDLPASRATGRFSAHLDLADLDAFLGTAVPEVTGVLAAEGEVHWSALNQQLDYTAAVTIPEAGGYGLAGLGPFQCSIEGDLEQLRVNDIEGSLWGGTIDGTVEVRSLSESPQVSARASLTGLSIADATDAAEMDPIPWDGWLDLGIVSAGRLDRGLVSDLEIKVRPSKDPSKFPLEGRGSFRHLGRDGSIDISDLQLAFGNRQAALRATGSISGRGDADLSVTAEFDSRTSLERLLAFIQPEAVFPNGTPDGRMSFHGRVLGPLGDRAKGVLDGSFSIQDFEFAGQRWDGASFRGTVTATGIEIRDGEAADGDGRLSLRGTLPFTPDQTLDMQASVQGFDARKLARASGFGLPVEGAVGIEARVFGSSQDPVVTSSIRVASPRLFGESFDLVEGDIRYAAGKFELASALVRRGESTLRATGSVEQASQEIVLDVVSSRWRIEEFGLARILAPDVSGTVEFDLTASGVLRGTRRPNALELSGHWEVADLHWNDFDLGHWSGNVTASPERQNIDFLWSANTLGGSITGNAAIWQTATPSYNGTVRFRDISTAILWRSLALPTGAVNGSITGAASFGGALDAPGTFEANGTVDTAAFNIRSGQDTTFQVSNVFPMRWSVQDGAIRFDSMSVGGPETDFVVDGSVELVGRRELDLDLSGTVNLLLLQGILTGTEWDGSATVGLRIGGSLDEPSIEGAIEFEDAGLSPSDFPLRLSGLTGSVRFENSEARIENLVAASGGGTVHFDGVVAYRNASLEYRLHARADDMRVNYPRTISSIIDGDLTLAGVGSTSILNGDLRISRMSIRSDVSFSDLFASLDRPPANRVSSPMLQGMQLNLHIGAAQQLPVETDLVRNVAADLELDLGGSVASPSVLGTVSITQGEIRMLGTHYQINRGDIRFLNPLQAEPVLDVELETRIRDIDLDLVLSGPARSLDLSYRSDPPIPFHDLVSLIAVGKEPTIDPSIASQRRIQQQSLVQTGADALLSQAISAPVDRRLQRFFGVSRIKVDPQIGGLEANPNPRISTEQQIGEEVTLIYSYDLSSAQQQSIRIEWNPNRRWSFLVTRDQNGLVGSDILFKVRLP